MCSSESKYNDSTTLEDIQHTRELIKPLFNDKAVATDLCVPFSLILLLRLYLLYFVALRTCVACLACCERNCLEYQKAVTLFRMFKSDMDKAVKAQTIPPLLSAAYYYYLARLHSHLGLYDSFTLSVFPFLPDHCFLSFSDYEAAMAQNRNKKDIGLSYSSIGNSSSLSMIFLAESGVTASYVEEGDRLSAILKRHNVWSVLCCPSADIMKRIRWGAKINSQATSDKDYLAEFQKILKKDEEIDRIVDTCIITALLFFPSFSLSSFSDSTC
jgi:hypothetical protein